MKKFLALVLTVTACSPSEKDSFSKEFGFEACKGSILKIINNKAGDGVDYNFKVKISMPDGCFAKTKIELKKNNYFEFRPSQYSKLFSDGSIARVYLSKDHATFERVHNT